MIPRPYIVEWQEHAPWKSFDQIEQDLIISRTLVVIFPMIFLKKIWPLGVARPCTNSI